MSQERIKSALSVAIEQVQQWRSREETQANKRLHELKMRQRTLESEISDLQRELGDNHEEQKSREHRLFTLPDEVLERTRDAIFRGLHNCAQLFDERNTKYLEQLDIREERVKRLISAPDISKKISEYEQFQLQKEDLGTLPESYQSAIWAHHNQVKNDLQPVFNAMNAPLDCLKENESSIGLVMCLEEEEGRPIALAVILPVQFSVYHHWHEHREGVAMHLMYRVLSAISSTLHTLGIIDAQIEFEEIEGLLSIQVLLEDIEFTGDIKGTFSVELESQKKLAVEMRVVRLSLDLLWVSSDVLTLEDVSEDESTGS